MRERLKVAIRTGRQVVDACDRPAVFGAATLGVVAVTVAFGIAGLGQPFAVFLYGAMLVGVYGFIRYGWPRIYRFHEGHAPDSRDPTRMRVEGLSADVWMFLTLVAGVTVLMLGLILLEQSLG